MAENNEIPENVDKMLFAQDLMNYVLGHTVNTSFLTTTFERYRDFVHNAFNNDIKIAVSFLYNKVDILNEDIFYNMLDNNSVNLDVYKMYADKISEKYFADGFDASCFLHYCVHLAGMAMYFYNQGISEAPYSAAAYIANALNNVDMTTGGWDTLNTVAAMFSSMASDTLEQLSPQMTSDEEASSSGEQNRLKDEASNSLVLQAENNCCSINELKEDDIQIQNILIQEFHSSSDSNNSTRTKLKELKESCSTSLVDVSARLNVEGKKVKDKSSILDTLSPGTSNTTGKHISSIKDDCKTNMDLPLRDISNDNDQNIPPPRSENESHMLEGISKSERYNSALTDEENNLPKEDDS